MDTNTKLFLAFSNLAAGSRSWFKFLLIGLVQFLTSILPLMEKQVAIKILDKKIESPTDVSSLKFYFQVL